MNANNLVTLNVFGYPIRLEDVDRILSPNSVLDEPESSHVAHFFKIPKDRLIKDMLTREMLIRYSKACDAMSHVAIGTNNKDIKEKLIDPITSAKRCFSYGEFLACIELCALNGEMLANFLCVVNSDTLKSQSTIEKLHRDVHSKIKKHIEKDDFYDAIMQSDRVTWLQTAQVVTVDECQQLGVVHEIRKKFFHRWGTTHENIEADALDALKNISHVAAGFLELLDKQKNNLDLIRIYMEAKFPNQ